MGIFIGEQDFTVRRPGAGAYDATTGEWVPGADTVFTVRGVLQPVSGRERQDIAEGYRNLQLSKFYTETRLNTLEVAGTAAPAVDPDVVEIDGFDWEVINQFDRTFPPGPVAHYHYILHKLEHDDP